jgi:hypothetical protein
MMEYFTDREKNFYLNLVHVNLTFLIGATTVVAVVTMQVVYAQHICGMFRIAKYVHVIFLLHWNNRRKIYENDNLYIS